MYKNNEDVIVLDTRNEYETRVGLFENAVDLQLDTFRDFPKAIEQLPEEYKDKQIVSTVLAVFDVRKHLL